MKPTILIALSVIITLMSISCDDYEISDKQADSFLKFYGAGLEDEGMKVITTDEGYLIMGNLENPGNGKDICVIRTDKFGNTLASVKTYGGEWDDFGHIIKPNPTGGYIIAGSTQKEEQGDLDVFLIHISSTGDTLWTKSYGWRSFDEEAYDLLVLDNNNIVMTGYIDSTDVLKDFLFIETNASGDLVNFNHIGYDNQDDVAYSIIPKGNSYFLAGYTFGTTQQLSKHVLLMQWNGIGASINLSSAFSSLGPSSEAVAIKALNENEYILSCVVQPAQGSGSQIYLVKIDDSGNKIWEKSFGERTVNIANDFTIHDGSLYVIGTSTNGETSGDMMILKTGLSGDSPLYFYAGDETSFTGNGFDFTPDGGYIVTGANFTNNNSVITMCKLDAEGLLR